MRRLKEKTKSPLETMTEMFSTGNYDANKGPKSGLSVPIIKYFWSHSRLISGPNQCVVLPDTYSMKSRVNTWISPAIVCLLNDKVKAIIELFF